MKRKVLWVLLAVSLLSLAPGCTKKTHAIKQAEYSAIVGAAEGTADFSDKTDPKIDIRGICSYVGEEIDYSTGIEVKNSDDFEEFQMWVDATKVDIYTVGNYMAVYRFVYDGKEIEKSVSVKIIEKEKETGSDSVSGQGSGENGAADAKTAGNNGTNSGTKTTNSGNANGQVSQSEDSNGGNAGDSGNVSDSGYTDQSSGEGGGEPQNIPDANGGDVQNPDNGGNSGNVDNGAASGGGENTGNSGNSANVSGGGSQGNQTATKAREIITTKRKGTLKTSTIGYTNIELLSGKYVKLKCTNAKYIVSTRTDVQTVSKNNQTYEVSKLIITYNTGAEQILETVEKPVK